MSLNPKEELKEKIYESLHTNETKTNLTKKEYEQKLEQLNINHKKEEDELKDRYNKKLKDLENEFPNHLLGEIEEETYKKKRDFLFNEMKCLMGSLKEGFYQERKKISNNILNKN
ncbi:MAG: hypothetical protein ABH971_01325 [bacterium]